MRAASALLSFESEPTEGAARPEEPGLKISIRPSTELRCPFCHDAVQVDDARICPACASAQHAACDLAHGGCAVCVVYGTSGRAPQVSPPPRRRSANPRRQEAMGHAKGYAKAALGLFLAMILAVFLALASLAATGGLLSNFTGLAGLVALFAGGSSVLCLIFSLTSLCRSWSAPPSSGT